MKHTRDLLYSPAAS